MSQLQYFIFYKHQPWPFNDIFSYFFSFSDNRHQLVPVIFMPHKHLAPDQDTAITRPKEARKWQLSDGQILIPLIMKMLIHFLSNGGKQFVKIVTPLLVITRNIYMKPPRQRRDQFYIIL